MKIYLKTIFILLFITSCSSSKKIIYTFFENSKDDKIILIEEKIPNRTVIETLNGMKTKKIDGTPTYNGSKILTYKEHEEISNLYNENKIVGTWKKKDFKINIIEIISRENIYKWIESFSSQNSNVFVMSNPVFLINKKYMAFYVSKSSTKNLHNPIFSKCLLYKKINGKYELIEEVKSQVLI